MAGIMLADNVEHVAGIVRQVSEYGPVVLVGHSRGGFTISGVGAAIPELVSRLVYISAWCCTEPLRSYTESPENSTSESNALGAALLAFLNTLQPDEAASLGPGTRVDANTWGRIPRTYIRLTQDRSIPPALQDKFICDADSLTPDNRFDVHSIDSSHVGFMFRPHEIATILAGSI